MANLDKLLRKLEQNKENAEKTTIHKLTVAGETFDVRTLTEKEKRDFFYDLDTNKIDLTVGDIIKKLRKYIYNSMPELPALATKAKDNGLIKSYYDIVEELFTPMELITIIEFIVEINNINLLDPNKGIEEIKK